MMGGGCSQYTSEIYGIGLDADDGERRRALYKGILSNKLHSMSRHVT